MGDPPRHSLGGDLAGAAAALEHAERVGRDANALDLAVRALLARARVEWARHNASVADTCCREGTKLAARAGSPTFWNDLEATAAALAARGGPALRIV